jgi:hypothetical protein
VEKTWNCNQVCGVVSPVDQECDVVGDVRGCHKGVVSHSCNGSPVTIFPR